MLIEKHGFQEILILRDFLIKKYSVREQLVVKFHILSSDTSRIRSLGLYKYLFLLLRMSVRLILNENFSTYDHGNGTFLNFLHFLM